MPDRSPSIPNSLRARLAAPVDLASLAVFRMLFGGVMLWEVVRYAGYGWIGAYYIDPPLHFTYPGFSWVRPLPGDGMYVFFAVMALLAAAVALGFAYRLSSILFSFGFTYWFLLEKARYQNHFYLILLLSLILCCLPAHAACSLDARLKPEIARRTVPAWMLWLVRFQIAVPFVFGGIAKITPDWLRGEPMRSWLAGAGDTPFVGPLLSHEWSPWLFSYGGLAFDLAIVPLLLWRRTRVWAYAANVAFHLTNACLFHIGIFPWFLIGATTIYFSPDWPRRVWAGVARLVGWRDPSGAEGFEVALGDGTRSVPATLEGLQPIRRGLAALLGAYVALQCLVPFHHYLYPGPSTWSYEGEYFVWHMRLAEKVSGIRFYVIDPATGVRVTHDPNSVLPRWQADALSVNPEMIRQYAHWLADQAALPGGQRPEVRVYVLNSLNGREPQRLVDPDVNLASVPFSARPAGWIVPLQDPRPGDWRPDLAQQ